MTFVTPIVPIDELKKLHHNLTKLEQLIQMIYFGIKDGGIREQIEDIYKVQENIEYIITEEKKRINNPFKK